MGFGKSAIEGKMKLKNAFSIGEQDGVTTPLAWRPKTNAHSLFANHQDAVDCAAGGP